MGQCCFARVCLSSSSVVVGNTLLCNINHQGAACDGGPVVLRPVRATPCYICVVQI